MVVAARAIERHPQENPAHARDLMVHDVHAKLLLVLIRQRPGADGQEAKGNELLAALRIVRGGKQIARELLCDEALKRLVLIE